MSAAKQRRAARNAPPPGRGGDRSFLYGAIAAVLILVAGVVISLVLVLQDDDGGNASAGEPTAPAVTGGASTGQADGPEPVLAESADHYTLLHEELTEPFTVLQDNTFTFGSQGYALTGLFTTEEEGRTSMAEWGLVDGYNATFEPVGLTAGIIVGRHYVRIQLLRFETVEGAREAWDHVVQVHDSRQGATPVDIDPVGNEWLGSRFEDGSIIEGTEDVEAAYERTAFRRGNLIAVIQVFGAAENLPEGISQGYAEGIDLKALGEGAAIAPTPFAEGQPTSPALPDEDAPTPAPGS